MLASVFLLILHLYECISYDYLFIILLNYFSSDAVDSGVSMTEDEERTEEEILKLVR